MSPFNLGRFARCGLLVLGALALSACAKQAEVVPGAEPQQPQQPPQPPQPKPRPGGGKGGPGLSPLGGLLGGDAPSPAAAQALKAKYEALLVGTWVADLGDGWTEELTYNRDGTYSTKLTGPSPANESGKYAVLQLVGTKGLKVRLGEGPGARTVTASFEGDELEQLSLRSGVTGTFRKK